VKTRLGVLIVVAVIVLLAASTNPSERDFLHWFDNRMKADVSGTDPVSGLVGLATGGMLRLAAHTSVRRQNLVLFSLFRIRVGSRDSVFLGCFGQFVGI
jgi:hypothetical protein